MFTNKDIEYKSIFVINCIENRALRVSNGELLLEELREGGKKTLTKLPFQKILALFVIGHITITTPLVEKCKKYNVAICVMKMNLRPVFFLSDSAEANYLLRQRQYELDNNDLSIARFLVKNKVMNQCKLLSNTRKKDELTIGALQYGNSIVDQINSVKNYEFLMGIEGNMAKKFFKAYFQEMGWQTRAPRVKCDAINTTLDIGYTILFNYIEANVRMFGFDPYIGVYHRLWFKRKSLICDLMEPFRCVIECRVRKSYNQGQFKESDFEVRKGEYHLKYDKSGEYYRLFYTELIDRKKEIFGFIRSYYRCFMSGKKEMDYSYYNY